MNKGILSEIQNQWLASASSIGRNSPIKPVIEEMENLAGGRRGKHSLMAQMVSGLPGVEHLNLPPDVKAQIPALQERARVHRQLQSFGIFGATEFERIRQEIAQYQASAEFEEKIKQKRDAIKSRKFKPVVPNIKIEIHLHEMPEQE